MSTTFIPRRSPRLAAKGTGMPLSECQQRRLFFLEHLDTSYKAQENRAVVHATIRQYMTDVENARGTSAKAALAVSLLKYIMAHSLILACNETFREVMLQKMHEWGMETPPIPDYTIQAEFRRAIREMVYIITGST